MGNIAADAQIPEYSLKPVTSVVKYRITQDEVFSSRDIVFRYRTVR